jgi:hypothetical protein
LAEDDVNVYKGINEDMTDDEIINQIKQNSINTDFDISDDTQIDNYLDSDFNSPDQTG